MLTLNILFQTALQVPKTKPRLDDLLGAVIGLSIQSCSQLRYIIAKGYKSVSRGKLRIDGAKSGENQVQTTRPFSVESHRMHLTLQQLLLTTRVKYCLPGRLISQCPRFLLGADHGNTLCLAVPKFQTPKKKAGVQHS